MKEVTAICDSGPLMALAKLGVISKVFSVYPALTISETVYHEVVISGLANVSVRLPAGVTQRNLTAKNAKFAKIIGIKIISP